MYKPLRAPSPAPQPAARWAPARRTPPSSLWGSWCRWSTPWPGTPFHFRTFSLGAAHAVSHSDSIKLCRERRRTKGERSVSGPWDHHHHRRRRRRLTTRLGPGSKAGRFWVIGTASVRLTCYTIVSFESLVTYKASVVRLRTATRRLLYSRRLKSKLCKWSLKMTKRSDL